MVKEIDFPILPTTHGYVKGRRCVSLYGDIYYNFEKIPFAKPPLGDLRFKAPQPPEKWNNILECFHHGPKPLQRTRAEKKLEGSEDCLYMNIYVKELKSKKPLPVLMYIYGGYFENGGAVRECLGPDYFMHEDVILVTSNYRVGSLGFMSFKDKNLGIPGNAGLKDQLAALKWLKANCLNFNGDPNNITLFGNSAGGISLHYLTITPKAKNLFHKAILQSGTVFMENFFERIEQHPYRLAKLNGYIGPPNDEKAIYHFLLKLNPEEITSNVNPVEEQIEKRYCGFTPTYEPYETEDGLFYDHPKDHLAEAWGNQIPMIIGGTTDEFFILYKLIKYEPRFLTIYKNSPELIVPSEFRKFYSTEEAIRKGQEIIEKYLHNNCEHSNFMEYLDLQGVLSCWHFWYRTCLVRLKYAPSALTFLYNFDFDSPTFNFYQKRFLDKGMSEIPHAEELSYLFIVKESFKLDTNSKEYQTIRRMIGMWCAFAKTSNPNCLAIAPTIWTPIRENRPLKCLNISEKVELVDLPKANDMEYFHNLFREIEL